MDRYFWVSTCRIKPERAGFARLTTARYTALAL